MTSTRAKTPRKKPARVRKTVENDETCLQKHCQQFLEKSGIWGRLLIFHVANERKGSIGAAMHFKRMGVRPGVADYLAFPPGRSVAIELKKADGDQRKNQEVFQRQWEAAGNTYHLIRTLDEFKAIVEGLALFA